MKQGVPKHIIYSMVEEGILSREERGLYSLTGEVQLSSPDLVKISMLVPKAIICLTSALYFYHLTTQIPSAIHIALPHHIRLPKVMYPPIDVIRLSAKAYASGIDVHILDGVEIKIYSPEKTITDCFKFRSKIGNEIAIEALKDYVKEYRPKVSKIIEYAKINRVEKIMRPYLETLL